MIDRTAKIKIIQLNDIVIAKRNGISAGAYYCGCDFDIRDYRRRTSYSYSVPGQFVHGIN